MLINDYGASMTQTTFSLFTITYYLKSASFESEELIGKKENRQVPYETCRFLVEEGGFEPPKLNSDRFTVCSLWPLGNSSILELVNGLEPLTC